MYNTIISSKNLKNILEDKDVIIFDCRFNLFDKNLGYKNYLKSHIKNSYYINLESDLSSTVNEHTGRHPLQDILIFSDILNFYGITSNTQIVVYDDENNSIGARLWWMLKSVGLTKCAVLDGGYKSWQSKENPISTIIPENKEKKNNIYTYDRKYIVDTNELKNKLKNDLIYLVDARDPERFAGKVEFLDKKAGHIPGAINIPFKKNIDQEGKFKSKDELLKIYEHIHNDSQKSIVNMCGSGVTACHNILAMNYCGLRNSSIYVGSWSAWSSYEDNPVKVGL